LAKPNISRWLQVINKTNLDTIRASGKFLEMHKFFDLSPSDMCVFLKTCSHTLLLFGLSTRLATLSKDVIASAGWATYSWKNGICSSLGCGVNEQWHSSVRTYGRKLIQTTLPAKVKGAVGCIMFRQHDKSFGKRDPLDGLPLCSTFDTSADCIIAAAECLCQAFCNISNTKTVCNQDCPVVLMSRDEPPSGDLIKLESHNIFSLAKAKMSASAPLPPKRIAEFTPELAACDASLTARRQPAPPCTRANLTVIYAILPSFSFFSNSLW
jgi:hypothetical protein